MKWIFCSIICWIVLLAIIDKKRAKRLFICGFLALTAQLLVDGFAIDEDFYVINDPAIPIFGSSLFFSIGVVLPMGVLVAQCTTRIRKYQVYNIVAWVVLFTLFEILAVHFKMMKHVDWTYSLSVIVNTMVMVMLTWFTEHFLLPQNSERRNIR
ncbi:MAG: hypothetical protein K6T85_14320 [Gorillibacterium sp.]|nr:hypothetical protein [Gorillibacterium sp.]